jgi:hypothetical protein
MEVNDNACYLNKRVALESIASELAPTENQGRSLRRFSSACTKT